MVRRPRLPRALLAATALTLVPAGGGHAQSLGLRGSDAVGGFPTSPSENQILTPRDQVSAPQIDLPAAAADELTSPAVPSPNNDGGANYGKPRKLRPKLYKPNIKTSPPLSPLVPYRGAPGTRRLLNPAPPPKNAIDPILPGPTVAVLPSPLRLRRPIEDLEPFDPIGVRAGSFIIKPFVEGSTGYETNPNQVAVGVKPSLALQTFGGAAIASDFSSGSIIANLRGGYTDYPSNSNANRPNISAIVDGRYDVSRLDTIDTEARFVLATQTPGSPLLAVPNSVFITNRPLITSEGATLGGTHVFGRLALGLKATFDRTQYGNATQSDGTVFPYSQENYNDYGAIARAAYEFTPALIPFAEIGADTRVRDNAIDISGYARNSTGGIARAGATFDFLGHFTGTASAGYLQRHYVDGRLPDLRGPSVDGALVYTMTPLTKLTLNASTTASETTLAGASGAISRSFGAELSHVFFRRFTLTGIAIVQPNDYQGVSGHEVYTTFTLKGAYSVTRDVQLIASASRQTLKSSFIGQGFQDNIFLVGARLQR